MNLFRILLLPPLILVSLLSACSGTGSSPITPAQDRLTFLYFYVDG